MSILEKAGLSDPEKVYDAKGHIKNKIFNDFQLDPDGMDESYKVEVGRHLNWCQHCQERQKQDFLPTKY